MATLAELKAQLRDLKLEIDKIQAMYDSFGNIEETPVGRVYAIKYKPIGSTDFSVDLFFKVSSDFWTVTRYYLAKSQSDILDLLAKSEVQWVTKVGAVDFSVLMP